jgi:hypothetical protein
MPTARSLTLFALQTLVTHAAHGQVAPDVAPAERSCTGQTSRILILGTCHMEHPGLDAVNLEADDVLLPRRQRELSELIEKLARRKPTK